MTPSEKEESRVTFDNKYGCCEKCIIPLDYKPSQCNDGDCVCHHPRETTKESWESEFDNKFQSKLFKNNEPDEMGFVRGYILKDFIRQLLEQEKLRVGEGVMGWIDRDRTKGFEAETILDNVYLSLKYPLSPQDKERHD